MSAKIEIVETEDGFVWSVDLGDGRGTRTGQPAPTEDEAERRANLELDVLTNACDD